MATAPSGSYYPATLPGRRCNAGRTQYRRATLVNTCACTQKQSARSWVRASPPPKMFSGHSSLWNLGIMICLICLGWCIYQCIMWQIAIDGVFGIFTSENIGHRVILKKLGPYHVVDWIQHCRFILAMINSLKGHSYSAELAVEVPGLPLKKKFAAINFLSKPFFIRKIFFVCDREQPQSGLTWNSDGWFSGDFRPSRFRSSPTENVSGKKRSRMSPIFFLLLLSWHF